MAAGSELFDAPAEGAARPVVSITYCTGCNWLLRAGWMAQELLQTFGEDLGGVTIVPGYGGVFEIAVDGRPLWERKRDGGFPEAKVLKQRLRDAIAPGRDLGHVDRHGGSEQSAPAAPAPAQSQPDPAGTLGGSADGGNADSGTGSGSSGGGSADDGA